MIGRSTDCRLFVVFCGEVNGERYDGGMSKLCTIRPSSQCDIIPPLAVAGSRRERGREEKR